MCRKPVCSLVNRESSQDPIRLLPAVRAKRMGAQGRNLPLFSGRGGAGREEGAAEPPGSGRHASPVCAGAGEGSRELQRALSCSEHSETPRGWLGGKSWAEAFGTSLESCLQKDTAL